MPNKYVETLEYRQDLRVTLPVTTNKKCTLYINNGDIGVVNTINKLATQLIRAIINDQTMLRDMINTTGATERQFYNLITTILKSFRSTQVNEVNSTDNTFTGYYIYRKAAGTSDRFVKISKMPVINYFEDTNLINGTSYVYGLSKVHSDILETAYIDSYTLAPSQFITNQKFHIGNYSVAYVNDSKIEFYVDYNKRFSPGELINKIKSIIPYQDSVGPRTWHVNVVVENMDENIVGVSTEKVIL